jgi:hypothetical protein
MNESVVTKKLHGGDPTIVEDYFKEEPIQLEHDFEVIEYETSLQSNVKTESVQKEPENIPENANPNITEIPSESIEKVVPNETVQIEHKPETELSKEETSFIYSLIPFHPGFNLVRSTVILACISLLTIYLLEISC